VHINTAGIAQVDAEILIILCAKSDCKNICWAIKIVILGIPARNCSKNAKRYRCIYMNTKA
jgi:hypothetical protein